jgi:pentatricopeptide repeat protein
LFPHNLIARVNFAHGLFDLGRPDEAAGYWREITRDLPSGAFYSSLMMSYVVAGRLDEAKAVFDEAEARKLDVAALHGDRELLAFLQRDNAALTEQWEWVAQHPKYADLTLGKTRGQMYYGQFGAARRLTEDAIKQIKASEPNLVLGVYGAEALQQAVVGNVVDARQAEEKAFARPQQEFGQSTLALASALTGDSAQAQKLADSLDQKSPRDTLVQNYYLPAIRAAIHLHANDAAGAIEILRPALKYDFAYPEGGPNSLYPAYIRGLAYLRLGDGHSAAVEFQKLIDHPCIIGRDVDGAMALLQMARAQKMAGDKAASRNYYAQFLTLWKDADSDILAYRDAKAEYARLTSSH